MTPRLLIESRVGFDPRTHDLTRLTNEETRMSIQTHVQAGPELIVDPYPGGGG
ncbi:MAG: hypothetical protein AAGE94_18085 [Acidobacteriota bacterium]